MWQNICLVIGFSLLGAEAPWVGCQVLTSINHEVRTFPVLLWFSCALSAGLIAAGFLFK